MPVITVTGFTGSGAPEVGTEIARNLGIDFVDRYILAEAARKMGTTEAVLAERTERAPTMGDRIAGFVRNVLERSALAGGGGDPYFGGGLDALLVRDYRDLPPERTVPEDPMSDENLLEVTTSVIREIATSGSVVIAGRGANLILRDQPGVLHVGLHSAHDARVRRLMEREGLSREGAEKYISENDKARTAYFQRFFKVQPEDPRHYHMVLNVDWLDTPRAAETVIATANLFAD